MSKASHHEPDQGPPEVGETIAISLAAGGELSVDGVAVSEAALLERLRHLFDRTVDPTIALCFAQDVPYGEAVELFDLLASVEFDKARVLVDGFPGEIECDAQLLDDMDDRLKSLLAVRGMVN